MPEKPVLEKSPGTSFVRTVLLGFGAMLAPPHAGSKEVFEGTRIKTGRRGDGATGRESYALRAPRLFFALSLPVIPSPLLPVRFIPLKNHSLVPGAACDALAVEVFEEGDGVLARDAGEFFEGRNVYQPLRLAACGVFAKRGDEAFERLAVEEEFFADAHERAGVNEELEDFAQVLAPAALARRGSRAWCARTSSTAARTRRRKISLPKRTPSASRTAPRF